MFFLWHAADNVLQGFKSIHGPNTGRPSNAERMARNAGMMPGILPQGSWKPGRREYLRGTEYSLFYVQIKHLFGFWLHIGIFPIASALNITIIGTEGSMFFRDDEKGWWLAYSHLIKAWSSKRVRRKRIHGSRQDASCRFRRKIHKDYEVPTWREYLRGTKYSLFLPINRPYLLPITVSSQLQNSS